MKKAIPLGIVDYAELQTSGYYVVDKSLMIQEYLTRKNKVTLITRPRRFGKTLNMSMMSWGGGQPRGFPHGVRRAVFPRNIPRSAVYYGNGADNIL